MILFPIAEGGKMEWYVWMAGFLCLISIVSFLGTRRALRRSVSLVYLKALKDSKDSTSGLVVGFSLFMSFVLIFLAPEEERIWGLQLGKTLALVLFGLSGVLNDLSKAEVNNKLRELKQLDGG